MARFKQLQLSRGWLILYFWLYICWCEIIVRYKTTQFFWSIGLVPLVLFSGVTALLLFTLCNIFPKKANRVLELISAYGLFVFFASQLIYSHVFHFYYSAYSVGNGGQILEFWRVTLRAIGVKAVALLLMLLPAVLLSVFGKNFAKPVFSRWYRRTIFAVAGIALHFCIVAALPIFGTSPMSPYDLYHNTNDLTRGAFQLGLIPAFRLDVHRLIFSFAGGHIQEPQRPTELITSVSPSSEVPEKTEPTATEEPVTEPEAEYNELPLDFDALLEEEDDPVKAQLHQYFKEQTPTLKNDKTGMFKGKNLIEIVAEGFSYLAIDPELTPTLYKLQTQGLQFTNFYTAYWGVSTSDGEYVTLTGTIPASGTWSFADSSDNAMPLTMAQQLKKLGYSAWAFHDHSYTYYHRDRSHPNLGYIFKAVGNGLEITNQWPESDVEMIDQTTAYYMGQEPFHAYYMTVSGHLEYNFDGNQMAAKHRELVEGLPYSEPVKAYLACQIELDRALELLLERLEEAGVAEDTVIVLTADHYPYGLTVEQQSELAGHDIDTHFELYRNACIIYQKGMTPEVVDRPCSSLDILPTLSNLFGLDFDSRLYMGQDVFSDAEPLIIFSDHSWLTDFGSYYTMTEELTCFHDGEEIPSETVEYYNNILTNKFLVSQWILETDYWRELFGDNLPPDPESPPKPTEEATDPKRPVFTEQ